VLSSLFSDFYVQLCFCTSRFLWELQNVDEDEHWVRRNKLLHVNTYQITSLCDLCNMRHKWAQDLIFIKKPLHLRNDSADVVQITKHYSLGQLTCLSLCRSISKNVDQRVFKQIFSQECTFFVSHRCVFYVSQVSIMRRQMWKSYNEKRTPEIVQTFNTLIDKNAQKLFWSFVGK